MISIPQGFEVLSNELIDSRLVMTKAEMRMVRDETRDGVYPRHYFVLCRPCANDHTSDCKPRLYVYDASNPYDADTGRFRVASVDYADVEEAIKNKLNAKVFDADGNVISEVVNTADEVGFKRVNVDVKANKDGLSLKSGLASIDIAENKAFYNKENANIIVDANRELATVGDVKAKDEEIKEAIKEAVAAEAKERQAADAAEAKVREDADENEREARASGDKDLDYRKVDKFAEDLNGESTISNTADGPVLKYKSEAGPVATVKLDKRSDIELSALKSNDGEGYKIIINDEGAHYLANNKPLSVDNVIATLKDINDPTGELDAKIEKEIAERKAADEAEETERKQADIDERDEREAADATEVRDRIAAIDKEAADRSVEIAEKVSAEKAERVAEDAKKVDKEVEGSYGKAIIFNEADGGGIKFERGGHSIESFVGVHDGDGLNDGKYVQTYVDEYNSITGKYDGSTISGYQDGYYYLNRAERAKGIAQNDPDHEIAVIKNVNEAVETEATARKNADEAEAKVRDDADKAEAKVRDDADKALDVKIAANREIIDGHTDLIAQNALNIDWIEDLIHHDGATPLDPVEERHLANKHYVDKQVQQYAASYVTNKDGLPFESEEALIAGPWYRAGVKYEPNNNDYAYVNNDKVGCLRYIYVVSETETGKWQFQIKISDKPFSPEQLAAINSGITKEKVNLIVDKEISGINGIARIFNEEDGGGTKFENKNGIESFVGVNDGSNGIVAQIYADKLVDGKWQGAKLDVSNNGMYYTVGNGTAAERMISANELATKGNLQDGLDKKLDLLLDAPGTSGDPYNLPYFFKKNVDANKLTVTAETISLDNKKTKGEYSMEIGSASADVAGLMSADDKKTLDAVETKKLDVPEGVKDPEDPWRGHPYNLSYAFDFATDPNKLTVTTKTVTLDNTFTERKYSADVPCATESIAGLMSAADKIERREVREDLTSEISRAEGKEDEITSSLNTEIDRATTREGELQTAINTEAAERKTVDTNLTNEINKEIDNRSAADTTLQHNIDAEVADRKAEDAKKVDKVISTTDGEALVFNEADGGGAKFTSGDYASFVGVNKSVSSGIGAQIYDIDTTQNKGVKIDVTKGGAYYTKGGESSKPAAQRDILDNELVVKKDLNDTASGKIDLLGDAPDGGPYRLTYFYKMVPGENKITVTAETISLDNKKTKAEFSLDVPTATQLMAGLMSAADKTKLDSISTLEAEIAELKTRLAAVEDSVGMEDINSL